MQTRYHGVGVQVSDGQTLFGQKASGLCTTYLYLKEDGTRGGEDECNFFKSTILLEIRAKMIVIIAFLLLNNNDIKSRATVVLCRMHPGVKETKNTPAGAP